MYGTNGKLLRVDLSRGNIKAETIDDDLYRLYPGGKALAGYILLKEIPPHTDPLSPENVLIFANGLLTGAPVSTASRYIVSARSPLTNAYGESEAGGFWGPELKNAGFEAIIVTGRSPSPVFLWIHDGQAEIRPAERLWGQEPHIVQQELRRELGDERIRVLQIGPAGEKLVRFAAITNDLHHFNGRNGMGAVMGSKNLRAIAVRGSQRYQSLAKNPQGLLELGARLSKQVKETPQSWDLQDKGTPGLVDPINAAGGLPTRNFRQGAFENVDEVKWEAYKEQLLIARRSCYACAVRCKRDVNVDGRPTDYGGPEYETVCCLGPLCGISDLQAIARANELCNKFVIDTITAGCTIAFAMECFEHGLIGLEDTDGMELRFGNTEAMLALIEKIGRREGFGRLLSEGSKRAADKIGGDAHFFAIQVKGQELAMHDPRGKYNIGIAYALSEIGADHLVITHDTTIANPESLPFKKARALGIEQALPAKSLSAGKMEQYYILEKWNSLEKVIGYCFFGPAPRSFIHPDDVIASINLATGWDVSMEQALLIGERAINLARVFNVREGFSRKDDTLPERLFQPLENGANAGGALNHAEFEQALTCIYELKGWDSHTSIPSRKKLEELSLGWAADVLDKTFQ